MSATTRTREPFTREELERRVLGRLARMARPPRPGTWRYAWWRVRTEREIAQELTEQARSGAVTSTAPATA